MSDVDFIEEDPREETVVVTVAFQGTEKVQTMRLKYSIAIDLLADYYQRDRRRKAFPKILLSTSSVVIVDLALILKIDVVAADKLRFVRDLEEAIK